MSKEGFQTVQCLKLGHSKIEICCSSTLSVALTIGTLGTTMGLSDGEVLWLDLISGLLNSLWVASQFHISRR